MAVMQEGTRSSYATRTERRHNVLKAAAAH